MILIVGLLLNKTNSLSKKLQKISGKKLKYQISTNNQTLKNKKTII